ncbi:MAG: 3-dehydroquinate synthase [Candidatus Goldiibacteriota bacterium]
MRTVRVRTKQDPYNVYVGWDILKDTGRLLKEKAKGRKIMIVSNKKVFGLHGAVLKRSLEKKFETSLCLLPDGEKYKNMNSLEKVYYACAKNKLDRYSLIIAFGGGVIGDTAGYAAATYMRGIDFVQAPTTLLAQVDSSIGGKTGIDMPFGKNMVGAFYQPVFVIADTKTLKTLEKKEFENGMAEAVKHGIIRDRTYFEFLKKEKEGILEVRKNEIMHLVKRSVEIKASIVSEDEREVSGLRAILNYGHTVGHAIEAAQEYKGLKHGQAVAAGAVIAAGIAEKSGLCSAETRNEQIKVFNSFNLIKPLKKVKISSILKRIYNDKKNKDGKIRFILTKKIGCATLIETVEKDTIKQEIRHFMAGRY